MITPKARPALLQKSFDAAIDPHSMEMPTQKNDAPAFFAQAAHKRFDLRRGEALRLNGRYEMVRR